MDGTSHYVWIALAGGAASFAHCLGMCGPFALHLSAGGAPAAAGPSGRTVLLRQFLWHAGRIFTYVFLGALAGFLGRTATSLAPWSWMQEALSLAMGAVMVLAGLKVLGLSAVRLRRTADATAAKQPCSDRKEDARVFDARGTPVGGGGLTGLLSSLLSPLLARPTPGGALVLGLATGFLPCPVVVLFLAMAVQGRSVPVGMATLAALGLGTAWSLGLLGAAGGLFRARLRKWGPALGGTVLVLLGLTTTLRGSEAIHRLLGCPHPSSGGADAGGADCCGSPPRPAGAPGCSGGPQPPSRQSSTSPAPDTQPGSPGGCCSPQAQAASAADGP